MSKIQTIHSLNEASVDDQIAVLTFLYESLFAEQPQDESKFEEILQPEFYPMIVKHAEDPEKSDKQKFVKLLGRAARNSSVETRDALTKAGAVSTFMSCLLSKDQETLTDGLNSAIAMAVDRANVKYMMVNGIIMLFINILTDLPDVKLVSLTLDALIMICKATKPEESRYITPLIPFFPNLMDEYETDDGVFSQLVEICNILASKHAYENSLIYALKDSGVMKLFYDLVEHKSDVVRNHILTFFLTVSTIQKGDFVDEMLKSPIVEYFTNYFKETRCVKLEKKFCKAIMNILSFSVKGRKSIFDSDIPKMIIDYINHTGNYKLQNEAVQTLYYMILNAASKSEIQDLVDQGCISALFNVFSSRDGVVLEQALSGLKTILSFSDAQYVSEVENYNGVYRLLEISDLRGTRSSELSIGILKQYFPDAIEMREADNVEDLLPIVDEEERQFQFNQEITVNQNMHF